MQQIEFSLLGISHLSKLQYSLYSFWRQNFRLW